MIYSKLEALNGERAMAFFGRTLARLKHIAKRAKIAVSAFSVVMKDSVMSIYMDGILMLQAVKNTRVEHWDISLTHRLKNFLALEKAVLL